MVLKRKDVAKRYGVKETTIDSWRKEGRMPPPLVIARTVRWREVDLIEWEAAGCPANFKKGNKQ